MNGESLTCAQWCYGTSRVVWSTSVMSVVGDHCTDHGCSSTRVRVVHDAANRDAVSQPLRAIGDGLELPQLTDPSLVGAAVRTQTWSFRTFRADDRCLGPLDRIQPRPTSPRQS